MIRWTGKKPTIPGWYWKRTATGVAVVEIDARRLQVSEDSTPSQWTVYQNNSETKYTANLKGANCEWYGPLAIPPGGKYGAEQPPFNYRRQLIAQLESPLIPSNMIIDDETLKEEYCGDIFNYVSDILDSIGPLAILDDIAGQLSLIGVRYDS